jgi:hypothetical protein
MIKKYNLSSYWVTLFTNKIYSNRNDLSSHSNESTHNNRSNVDHAG